MSFILGYYGVKLPMLGIARSLGASLNLGVLLSTRRYV